MAAFSQLDSEFRVNTYTSDAQQSPNIAANPSTRGFQIVWQSDGQDGFLWGVYGQNFNAKGQKVGSEISIADLTDGDQESPDVAFNEDGSGMWVWQSTMQMALSPDADTPPVPTTFPGVNYEVRSKLFGFDSDSPTVTYIPYEVQRENTQSNSNLDDDLIDISVHSLGGDRFLTAWYSKDEPRDEYAFMVESVDANTYRTNVSGEELFGIAEPFGSTNWGDVALLREVTDRRFGNLEEYIVVSSQSGSPDASDGKIIFQIFQQDLTDGSFNYDTRLFTDYNDRFDVANSGATGSASKPHVAVLKDGGFAITWQEHDERGGNASKFHYDTYVQVYNDDFTPRAGKITVDTGSSDETLPEITALKDGGFAITWTDSSGRNDDVMLQRFNSKGWKLGEEVMVNDKAAGDQNDSALATLNNGDVAVTWTSSTGDKDDGAVMAKVFDVTGYGAKQAQHIVGTNKNEKFVTKAKDDSVDGGGGRDTIKGGNGNDTLIGGSGNDKLLGGAGNDRLDGGTGNDVMTGGGGRDSFLFNKGKDKITDFQNNQDTVLFDSDLGKGGNDLSKSDLKKMAEKIDGGLFFDFGSSELTVLGVNTWKALSDDIAFV